MIRCACIRGNYNYYVEALDHHNLVYKDYSDWMEEDRYDEPETYKIIVTAPDEATGKEYEFNVKGLNRIHFNECIKDGIWCFETESCGVKYKRTTGIFYTIECCLTKALVTQPEKYEDIKEVEKYLDFSKAAINYSCNIWFCWNIRKLYSIRTRNPLVVSWTRSGYCQRFSCFFNWF